MMYLTTSNNLMTKDWNFSRKYIYLWLFLAGAKGAGSANMLFVVYYKILVQPIVALLLHEKNINLHIVCIRAWNTFVQVIC